MYVAVTIFWLVLWVIAAGFVAPVDETLGIRGPFVVVVTIVLGLLWGVQMALISMIGG